MERYTNSRKERLYEAKIILDNYPNDIYYREKFLNYDDAVDKCNSIYYKLDNKNEYIKKIDRIK